MFTKIVSSPISATIALALFNSSSVIGQILIGHLTDRIPYPHVMLATASIGALAAFLLWGFATTVGQIFAFAIVFGGLVKNVSQLHHPIIMLIILYQMGGFPSVWWLAMAECAGSNPEQTGMAFGGTAFFRGLAAVLGPILSGILYENGKATGLNGSSTYGQFGFGIVEIFVGSCAVATGLGSIVVAAARQRISTRA